MLDDDVFRHDSELASTPDFYFPEQKVAVYCDSTAHHGRKKDRERDELIRARVRELGFKTVGVEGSDIVKNLDKAVEQVISNL